MRKNLVTSAAQNPQGAGERQEEEVPERWGWSASFLKEDERSRDSEPGQESGRGRAGALEAD